MKKKTNYKIGHFSEKMALWYLRLKGYHLIKMNYITGRGTGAGEIDLIMKKKNNLIFIEVKKRQNKITAGEAITIIAKKRIAKAAEVFIAKHPSYQSYNVRFDAILFDNTFLPRHIQDAWRL